MNSNPLVELSRFQQSPWYDHIHRSILQNGELKAMIEQDGLKGLTSNPAIFEKAVAGSNLYDADIDSWKAKGITDAKSLFYKLAIEDIRQAADLLRDTYEASNGHDGLVSLEISPDLAYNTEASIKEAHELFDEVDRPNLMIKVPATKEGLPVIESLIADGINVNATLLFSVDRYVEVAQAFINGLKKRAEKQLPVDRVASVASFFVSRVDNAIDKLLAQHPDHHSLLGKAAIANAKLAYRSYQELFGDSFQQLGKAGAQPQRLLWASTGVKNPDYSDIYYIETLIGHNTVTTIPPATYLAFRDHGNPSATLESGMDEAAQTMATIQSLGINLTEVTQQLEDDGVELFAKAFETLLQAIDNKAQAA